MLSKQSQTFQQQVAEVDRVQLFQPALVRLVERRPRAVREGGGFAERNLARIETPVLPCVDLARQRASRPTLVVDVGRLQNLLDQPDLIVRVEDGEIRLEADQFGVPPQNLGPDRMERAHPRHAVMDAGQRAYPLAHLPRRLVGECDGKNFMGPGASGRDQVRDTGGEHPGLPDPCAGQNEDRTVERLDRATLLGVQSVEIAGRPARRQGSRYEFRFSVFRIRRDRSDADLGP